MEGEIQRKKEHKFDGSNFEEARGFERRNWASKHFDYRDNPLMEESSEEEYYDEEYGDEYDGDMGVGAGDGAEKEDGSDVDEEDDAVVEDFGTQEDLGEENEGFARADAERLKLQQQQHETILDKRRRDAKSAYPTVRNKRGEIVSNAAYHDLTKD